MEPHSKDCDCKAPLAPQPFFYSSRDTKTLEALRRVIKQIPHEMSREECLELIENEKQKAATRLREEQEQKVLRTFPNLLCYADNTSDNQEDAVWKRYLYIRHNSVLVGELKRFRGMRIALERAKESVPKNLPKAEYREAVAESQDRVLYNLYLEKYSLDRIGFEESRKLMQVAISNVRAYMDEILKEYFPINRRRQMEFAANVYAAHTMPQLIELIYSKRGKGVISRRIPFEARIIAVLAQLEFESLIGSHNPDTLDQIRNELISRLENDVFSGSESARVIVVAKLDPENHYRVKQNPNGEYDVKWFYENDPGANQQTSETVFVLPLDVRVIKKNGHSILIYFDSRRKQRVFAKQLRKNQRKPDQITDLSGIVMVLLNNSLLDEEYLANRLRATIVNCPGLVSAQQSNASRAGAIDPDNPHSSPNRRGEKYEFLWATWHELQILALPDFINSLVAHAQDGHPFYKLVTYLDTLFPWIWPKAIYGLDWYEQDVRDMLWRHQCRMLQAA